MAAGGAGCRQFTRSDVCPLPVRAARSDEMASSAYLRGHDFYALKRRASAPGSGDAVSPTGFLNYDAWILEGLETLDANVRALGVMMTSTDEELGAVASASTPVVVRTDGRGHLQPCFRPDGLTGWIQARGDK